ncbi:MAG: stage II sporulation protein D [Oscillospiraceae bacterium]|jgi:stage II sporulation protein D|nr:stage II sporulation protein D [Oscillospiraceae bacterium]
MSILMKIFSILCICVTLAMTVIPLMAYEKKDGADITEPSTGSQETTNPPQAPEGYSVDEIAILDAETGEVSVLHMRDYIIGAVAAEMPASYHDEALKAQALACFTYAVRKIREEEKKPTASLKGAHVSTDSRVHQAYMSVGQMKERWGDQFAAYYDKIAADVDAVAGKMIVYEDEPIVAVFHAISSGKTEKAENIWGGSTYPYLVSAESEGDVLSPQFSTTTMLTEKQFAEIAKKISGVKLGDDPAKWVGKTKLSESGTVLSVAIGGKELTGTQVREAFSLRSPTFSVSYDDDGTFTFQVSGYGHGVGMSQYGADYMARQGSSYEDIIKHYYTGVSIATME